MKSIYVKSIITIIALTILSSIAVADVISFETPDNTFMDGQPVDAQVTFTTGTDSITVVLENLQIDPKSVVQNLSGLVFSISSGENSGTVTSSSGLPRTIDNDGVYSDGAAVDTGWELGTLGEALHLHVLGTDIGPAHTLIGYPNGSDLYSNAKGSIAGNKPHNPFLAESATFVLDIPGVTEDSTILGVTFEFNTSPGSTVTVGEPPLIPEPATLSLLAFGGLLILKRQRRRRS
ncbi:MAG: PEP-CTERM sorting domain-containing protein [Phycisphaerae bacterium]|jgi:hypothetical protein|nr:PEP-CTERM sorting domain-containing protein [Phycisphaerae bacterium]